MIDREKVIDGLNETISYLRLKTGGVVDRCIQHQYDALELLKEQEAQTVLSNRVCESDPCRYVRKGFCPQCHQEVEWLLNRSYCGFCGQAVKWE